MIESTKIEFRYRRIGELNDLTDLVAILFPGNRNQRHAAARILIALKHAKRIVPSLGFLEHEHGLLRDAAGLVLFHTHPSGDPAPSAEDLAFTRRLADAGETVGIRLIDHLIVGTGGRWVSLRQRGAL